MNITYQNTKFILKGYQLLDQHSNLVANLNPTTTMAELKAVLESLVDNHSRESINGM